MSGEESVVNVGPLQEFDVGERMVDGEWLEGRGRERAGDSVMCRRLIDGQRCGDTGLQMLQTLDRRRERRSARERGDALGR